MAELAGSTQGDLITLSSDGVLSVSDHPIIPLIAGGGTGSGMPTQAGLGTVTLGTVTLGTVTPRTVTPGSATSLGVAVGSVGLQAVGYDFVRRVDGAKEIERCEFGQGVISQLR